MAKRNKYRLIYDRKLMKFVPDKSNKKDSEQESKVKEPKISHIESRGRRIIRKPIENGDY